MTPVPPFAGEEKKEPSARDLNKVGSAPMRERPGAPTQDELLDEALKETFPASDPISVYRLD